MQTVSRKDYPLLALLPEGFIECGDLGFVQTSLVIADWHGDEIAPEVRAKLGNAALQSAHWAMHHRHLTEDGQWMTVPADAEHSTWLLLELVSWETAYYWQNLTRH